LSDPPALKQGVEFLGFCHLDLDVTLPRVIVCIDFWKNEKLNKRGELFSVFVNQCGRINLAGANFAIMMDF